MEFVIYAHRGSRAYAPDNTLAAFYLGLAQGADGIELDVQQSSDNKLVIFHDQDLEKATGYSGEVSEYTLEELENMKVKAYYAETALITTDKIISLETFIKNFGFRDLTFAIEVKQPGISEHVYETLKLHNILDKVIITSFIPEELTKVRRLDREVRLGYLTSDKSDKTWDFLNEYNIQQYCLRADLIDENIVNQAFKNNISIRAWGVSNQDLMKETVKIGVDGGMTIDFPDKLVEYMKSFK